MRGLPSYRRNVVDARRDTQDPKRSLFLLDCGHTVSRRQQANKSQAVCGHCQRAIENGSAINGAWDEQAWRYGLRSDGKQVVNP